MNQWNGTGRLTMDPESKMTSGDLMIVSFTLAVDRKGKDKGADFIPCKAFGKTAEVIAQYVKKGSMIGITGRIQTGSYDAKDGTKRYTTDVMVNEFYFLESKRHEPANMDQFADLEPVDSSDIPF